MCGEWMRLVLFCPLSKCCCSCFVLCPSVVVVLFCPWLFGSGEPPLKVVQIFHFIKSSAADNFVMYLLQLPNGTSAERVELFCFPDAEIWRPVTIYDGCSIHFSYIINCITKLTFVVLIHSFIHFIMKIYIAPFKARALQYQHD